MSYKEATYSKGKERWEKEEKRGHLIVWGYEENVGVDRDDLLEWGARDWRGHRNKLEKINL